MKTDYHLDSKDTLTALVKQNDILSWNALTNYIKTLPYGRNANRTDFSLVISESKGTCSSKHALLKQIADFNSIPNIELIIGIYKMNPSNTPKIGVELTKKGIDFIPEAHCYLKVNNKRIDFTTQQSEFKKIENDIIEELIIQPNQVAEYKVNYHKTFIKNWLKETDSNLSFEEIWETRERCIKNLGE